MNIFKITAFLSLATVLSACQTMNVDGPSNVRIYKDSSANQPYGLTTSTELARTGETSQRFEVRHGDCGREYDCQHDRRRVELSEGSNYHAKVGDEVWYGWSVYLTPDFVDIYPAITHIGQAKNNGTMIWGFMAEENGLLFEHRPGYMQAEAFPNQCTVSSLDKMRGRWSDIVIYANYNYTNDDNSDMLKVWINDKLVCTSKEPVLSERRTRIKGKKHVSLRYGVYNSSISEYYLGTGNKVLPTQVVYYDNVRTGKTRAEVDVNMQN